MPKHSYTLVELFVLVLSVLGQNISSKRKTIPVQVWTGPQGSRKLRLPDFKQSAHEGGYVQPHIPAAFTPLRNIPDTHFCQRLGRPVGLSPMENRTRNLPACNALPQTSAPPLRTG
jgi:hypothetical protein